MVCCVRHGCARVAWLATPTLLIWGDRDVIAPLAAGQKIAALAPNARLRVIEGCGHLPQQERPDALIELIEAS
jgi:pimeloyl-ACP methyl ester carboxylesterase